jgi:DNA-binding transcriptional LysR family regulator
MELRQLKYFLAVADARSFVSAAEKQFVSRQAISKSVALLEEELNVELFMRDSSGAFLTPAGIMFYERARAVVMELDNLRNQMQAYGTRYQQRIRMAFSIGTMLLLEEKLNHYRENQHNADLSFEEYPEDLCQQMLQQHKADLLITTQAIRDPLYAVDILLESPFGILIRQQENLQEVSIRDLSWIPVAGQKDSQTQEFCQKNNISLRYQGYDLHRLFALTQQGKCALLLPKCLCPAEMEGLQWLPLKKADPWQLYLIRPRSADKNLLYSAALDDLQHHVFDTLAEEKENSL